MMLIEQGNRVKQSVPYDSAKPPVRVTDKGPKASPSPGQNLQAPQRECAGARASGVAPKNPGWRQREWSVWGRAVHPELRSR